MRLKQLMIISVAILLSSQAVFAADSYYFKINKAFELYGEAFREVITNYVENLDPDELAKLSIEGMLADLDPYTVYMGKDDNDDLDFITNGKYTGFGITVADRDSLIRIVDMLDDYSARSGGLKIGDKIFKINSDLMLHKTSDDLRKYSRGKAGEQVEITILRGSVPDTLNFKIKRRDIRMHTVSCAEVIHKNIAYIKIDRFDSETASEVRDALKKLKRQVKVKAVVLDLRDNPGGILNAAVSVAELFLPPDNLIVTTRGRDNGYGNIRRYKSLSEHPEFPDEPLAVLINGSSASASEVLAGCFQDLDRGVVVGETSYGKGLVQTVINLPYDTYLKITTGRYYTPSGRCIQKYEYKDRKKQLLHKTDSVIFMTRGGRDVVEAHGIIPDTIVKPEANPEVIEELISSGMIFDFAADYVHSNKLTPGTFKFGKGLIEEFNSYLEKNDFIYKSKFGTKLKLLKELGDKRSYSENINIELENLINNIKQEELHRISSFDDRLTQIIEQEIRRMVFTQREMQLMSLKNDLQVNTAVDIISNKRYKTILSVHENIEVDTKKD